MSDAPPKSPAPRIEAEPIAAPRLEPTALVPLAPEPRLPPRVPLTIAGVLLLVLGLPALWTADLVLNELARAPVLGWLTLVVAIAGFGLLQRDRDFRSYEDTEAHYERRPGAWIEPIGAWPAGKVRLLEIPSGNEYADNIVASWMPLTPPEPGKPFEFSYRLHWTNADAIGGPQGWVESTRQTVQVERPRRTKFVIDFDAIGLKAIPASANVTAETNLPPEVAVLDQRVFRNETDGSWRLALLLDAPQAAGPLELRARLLLEGKPITETWVNPWQP